MTTRTTRALLRGGCRARAALAVVAALSGIAAVGAPPAAAEVGAPPQYTRQAVALESQFLVEPRTPPVSRSAVCLVDSGVDEAAADLAPGQLLHAEALDGGTPSDTFADKHGTLMARMMGAQLNGTGMVGIWPAVGIVSVRATKGDEQSFRYAAFSTAIRRCTELRADGYPITVVSLSLGGDAAPDPATGTGLQDAIDRAREKGLVIVAAGGNAPDSVVSPARERGVTAAIASDNTGLRCSFSPAPTTDAALLVPGCDLDQVTYPGVAETAAGASQATAILATVVAAARAYRPDASVDEVERALRSAQRFSAKGFFNALGIDSGTHAASVGLVTTDGGAPTPVTLPKALARPSVRSLRRRGNSVVLRLTHRAPAGTRLSVSIRASRPGSAAPATVRRLSLDGRTTLLRVRVPRRTVSLALRYVGGVVGRGPARTLAVPPLRSRS